MNFKKVFRGYDPKQVESYIAETATKEQQIRTAQKERIDELSDENYALRQQLKQYQTDEQAISHSLIESQTLASKLREDADKYADAVLTRAKVFYATWRAYAQTLVYSLSADEVAEFNELQRKMEHAINDYEGNSSKVAATTIGKHSAKTKTAGYTNPIRKVETAVNAIELDELTKTDVSLEDICTELGLMKK